MHRIATRVVVKVPILVFNGIPTDKPPQLGVAETMPEVVQPGLWVEPSSGVGRGIGASAGPDASATETCPIARAALGLAQRGVRCGRAGFYAKRPVRFGGLPRAPRERRPSVVFCLSRTSLHCTRSHGRCEQNPAADASRIPRRMRAEFLRRSASRPTGGDRPPYQASGGSFDGVFAGPFMSSGSGLAARDSRYNRAGCVASWICLSLRIDTCVSFCVVSSRAWPSMA